MIPKIIHWCWLSNDEKPALIKKCIASWKEKLPDYEIKLWNMENVPHNDWVDEALGAKKYAFVADYVRVFALYNFGGIYLDSDVEVVKKFDELLQEKCFFGYEYTGLPEAAVVGAEKGTAFFKNAVDFYDRTKFLKKDGSFNQIIAPLVLKYAFESYYDFNLTDDEKIHSAGECKIFPYDFFSAKNGFSGKIISTENTFCIHHFNSAWLKKNFFTRLKKIAHLLLIKIFGKIRYNKILYGARKVMYRTGGGARTEFEIILFTNKTLTAEVCHEIAA